VRKNRLLAAIGVVSASVVLASGVASAHVTIEPESAPQGAGDQVLTLVVPNETEDANTIGLRVQFPLDHPIAAVVPEVMPGWTSTVKTTHLTTPIVTDDGTVTDVVSEVDWTGGKIPPKQFSGFTVLAQGLPKGVDSLTIKAIQNYDNGTAVSWIEVPDASHSTLEHPAPVLKLTAASDTASTPGTTVTGPAPGVSITVTTSKAAVTAPPSTTAPSTSSSDSSNGLAVGALALGAVAIVLAGAAIAMSRSKSSTSSS